MARIALSIVLIMSLSLNIALSIHHFKKEKVDIRMSELKLKSSQKQKLDDLHNEVEKRNKAVKLKIYECQQELMKVLRGEEVDKVEVNKCLNLIAELQKELQHNSVQEILEVKKILTTQQCECFLKNLNQNLEQNCKADCEHRPATQN